MPKSWREWLAWLAAQGAITVAFHWIVKLIYKLGENAVLGWGDDRIAEYLGITAASIIRFFIDWGTPFCLAAATLYFYHLFQTRRMPNTYKLIGGTGGVKAYRPTANEMPPSWKRGRWWYAFWGGPPFHSYKARKRLEFIDSWQDHFDSIQVLDRSAPSVVATSRHSAASGDLTVTAPPPISTPQKKNTPEPREETNLIGTARLLYNAEEQKLSVLQYDRIQSVAIERPNALAAYGPPFIIKFVFLPYQGPFDIAMEPTSNRTLSYEITENEDRFASIKAGMSVVLPVSHELRVRFFRRSK